MTYEASRKKQLLVLQPKGKPLYDVAESEGANKSFGLKMLESMGWKKGNGLGRTQQGNLDFISVRYKNNANGLGFNGLKDDQWTETESSFDNLLKHLNSTQSTSNSNSSDEAADQKKKPAKSLEEMSKKSRARVHYKKFTKGKDVYKYSEKDLANILGKKSLKEDEKKEEKVVEPEIEEKPETYKSDLIVNTGISIADYFKQKRKEKLGKSADDEEDVPQEKPKKRKKKEREQVEEIEMQPLEEINETVEDATETKRKKKKRKRESIEEQVEETVPIEPEVPKKKKKSKKSKQEEDQASEHSSEKVSKKKNKQSKEEVSSKTVDTIEPSNVQPDSNQKNNVDRPRGANAVYSTDVILIPSHVAQKMSSVLINNFNNSNLGDIVGYGMTDDIEIKVVETKMGGQINNDKYALYNMDRITKPRVNTRKILTKIKKTKKSIQVI